MKFKGEVCRRPEAIWRFWDVRREEARKEQEISLFKNGVSLMGRVNAPPQTQNTGTGVFSDGYHKPSLSSIKDIIEAKNMDDRRKKKT